MTMLRSTVGNAALFGAYEIFKYGAGLTLVATAAGEAAALAGMSESSVPATAAEAPLPRLALLACGIAAGWASWLSCFPLDAVKTRLQVHSNGHSTAAGHQLCSKARATTPPLSSIAQTFRQLWREGALYR